MLCLYHAYPLALMMNYIVRGTIFRHLFATITGLFLQYYMYRGQIMHSFAMTIVVYAMMNFLPRGKTGSNVFVFVMLYLSGQHIYRMYNDYGGWRIDVTTYTMILTAKLSALAYCYRDGGK